MLSAMRFKDFTWPHNPRTFRVLWRRRVCVLDAPGGRYHVQDLGRTCRILRGEGEFCGPDAYADFERLQWAFLSDGPGTLVHPLWHSQSVYFTRLELTQEPRQDYVAYAFEFTETRGYDSDEQRKSVAALPGERYTLSAGDTAWSVGERFGLDMQTLLALNPGLSNPNELGPGQEVRVG